MQDLLQPLDISGTQMENITYSLKNALMGIIMVELIDEKEGVIKNEFNV